MFQSINLKLGNMRKPDSFVVYPGERYDSENGQYWMLQGNNRVAKIYENGKCRLSKRVNGHPTFMYLNLDAFQLQVSSEIVNELRGKNYEYADAQRSVVRIIGL